jgi:phosphate transport system substrate-binding protein
LGALGALLLVATSGAIVAAPAAFAGGPSLLGGGSGFAALEIDQWRADTARNPYNLSINYQAQGSSFGRAQFTAGTFDFGASDIQYMQTEIPDLQNKKCNGSPPSPSCFVYVPVSAGGLSFMYNLRDGTGAQVTDLKLTRDAACKIFTGAITQWSDPELVHDNPRLAGVTSAIVPVIRADGAGESFVLSEFCKTVDPAVWNAFVAQQKASTDAGDLSIEFAAGEPTSVWPQADWGNNPVGVPFADGTADYVADQTSGPNSITYVAAGYAKVRNFPVASVQNAAGVFTQPDETNVTVALAYATPVGNGTFHLNFTGPDPRAYFPSTYSYILAQTGGYAPARGAVLSQFLCYAVSLGQAIAPSLRYARLSSQIEAIAIAAIVLIPGAPTAANCPIAGAPPPPPPISVVGGGGGGGPGSTALGGGGGGTGAGGVGPGSAGRSATAAKTAAAIAAVKRAKLIEARKRAAQRAVERVENLQNAQLNGEIAKEAQGHGPGTPWHVRTIWVLLAGVAFALVAWIVATLMSRKTAVA